MNGEERRVHDELGQQKEDEDDDEGPGGGGEAFGGLLTLVGAGGAPEAAVAVALRGLGVLVELADTVATAESVGGDAAL